MQEVLEQQTYVVLDLCHDSFLPRPFSFLFFFKKCTYIFALPLLSFPIHNRFDVPTSKFDIMLLNIEMNFLSQKKARNETIDAAQLASYLSSLFVKQVA